MKIYRNNWSAKTMIVNFNQSQWRQDLAAFVSNKLKWIDVRVSRSKLKEENANIKEFEIFDSLNNKCIIKYASKSEILSSSYPVITEEYLKRRQFNQENFE